MLLDEGGALLDDATTQGAKTVVDDATTQGAKTVAADDLSGEVGSQVTGDAGGGSCPLSFSPDTAVATPQGEVPIAQLKAGDQVTAYDPNDGHDPPPRRCSTSGSPTTLTCSICIWRRRCSSTRA